MASSIRSDLPTQSHSTSASVQTVKTSKDFPVACLSRAGPTSEHKTIILDKPEVVLSYPFPSVQPTLSTNSFMLPFR